MNIKDNIKPYFNYKNIKKLDHNTYLLDNNRVLLHNTIILEQVDDEIEIVNGGWYSVTTKDRINKYIDPRYTLYQKDFTWYIKDQKTGKTLEYSNYMKVKGDLNV